MISFFFVISIPTVVSSCYSTTATCTEPEIISFTSYVSIFLLPCTRRCQITIFTHGLSPNNIAIILVDLVVTWSSNHKPPTVILYRSSLPSNPSSAILLVPSFQITLRHLEIQKGCCVVMFKALNFIKDNHHPSNCIHHSGKILQYMIPLKKK